MQITDYGTIKSNNTPPKYTIYAYNKYCEDVIGHNKWKCMGNGEDASEVLQEAQRLFNSKKFQKIEVKKKAFDLKKNRHLVSTFRVFDMKPKKNLLFLTATVILALSFGGLLVLEML